MHALERKPPEAYAELVYRTGLAPEESAQWQQAADTMYVAFDEGLGIHPQDDGFLDLEVWDFARTPPEHHPLLLHYHPLVIYRRQVLKQPDVVFAMFLLGEDFTPDQKRRNFDYYDPLTTGDSSLSACIQSIMAAELGYATKASEYWKLALLMDMADVGGNVKDGCHIASMGGSWMAAVYGFAGMRDRGGRLSFDPRPYLDRLHFVLTLREQRLEVCIENGAVTYTLHGSAGLTIEHRGERLSLRDQEPVRRDVGPPPQLKGSAQDCDPRDDVPVVPRADKGSPLRRRSRQKKESSRNTHLR